MNFETLRMKKLSELRELGKAAGIKNLVKLRKAELIQLLTELDESSLDSDTAKKHGITAESLGNSHQDGERRAQHVQREARRQDETESRGVSLQFGEGMEPVERSIHPAASQEHEPEKTYNTDTVQGILEVLPDGYGFLRSNHYLSGPNDIYIAPQQIRRFRLRTGDFVEGQARPKRDTDKFQALIYVDRVNGEGPEAAMHRRPFETLTPIYPNERLTLEHTRCSVAVRMIDLIAPIGKGQRGMIVAPPKAGKTTLMKDVARSIAVNYPDITLIVLLIDERPEEVTDMQRSIQGEVVYSTFDELPEHHVKVSEMVLERAQRLVEHGKDVVILMDSITRLARAYNLTVSPSGRTLSGGLDPGALHKPKRFFGAARNIEHGGSLTILATALVETGSRMDDMIFEEFKGTGNMEVHLDRKLSERRIFPAIDVNKSGTRREDLLLTRDEMDAIYAIRKELYRQPLADVTETLVSNLVASRTNQDWVALIQNAFRTHRR